MPNTAANLGRMLLKGLVTLREKKGQITLDDVGELFVHMSSEYQARISEADQYMHEEIGRLVAYIDETNREIFAITTNDTSDAVILDASQHLDEVIKETDQASNTIMDAADVIQQSVVGIGGENEKKIMEATNRIYDACNFQDITSQRITKVIKLLANIEQRVGKLSTLLSTIGTNANESSNVVPMPTQPSDKDLLNGPAHSGQATTQEEIDQIFASLSGKS